MIELGCAEDLIEYNGPHDAEVGGQYSQSIYAYYEDSDEQATIDMI